MGERAGQCGWKVCHCDRLCAKVASENGEFARSFVDGDYRGGGCSEDGELFVSLVKEPTRLS